MFTPRVGSAMTVKEVENEIVYFAEKQGVNPDLALAIARCESGLQITAKNPNSSAGSIFQFINSTWKSTTNKMGWISGADKYDGHLNIVAGIWLLKKEGVAHWEASRKCWEYHELAKK